MTFINKDKLIKVQKEIIYYLEIIKKKRIV